MPALTQEQKELAHRGQLLEENLSIANTKFIYNPGEHTLYILNFSVNNEFRSIENFAKLRKSFYAQLIRFAEENIFFTEIYVNVFVEDYEAFWRDLGFQYITDNKVTGKIYMAVLPGNKFPIVPKCLPIVRAIKLWYAEPVKRSSRTE